MTPTSSSPAPPARYAAIDIGTNSIHMVVANATADGGFDVLSTEKEMVRLGSGAGDMKLLTDDAIDRGVATLRRMAELADSMEAEVAAVATSAVREAENREVFLERVRAEAGLDVEVISGVEEARIIHLGVLQALPVYDQRLVLVDIGGGSTELLIGDGDAVLDARSTKLGAIRLTERFFRDPSPGTRDTADVVVTPERAQACRRYVRASLAPVVFELANHQPTIAVGSSGTVSTISAMAAAQRGETDPQINGSTFTRQELMHLADAVVACPDHKRHKLPGIDPRRHDLIVGGVLLLAEILQAFDLPSMTVSAYALREGTLFDRFAAGGLSSLRDLRRSNVARVTEQLDPDPRHARHITRLAEQLFVATKPLHNLGDAEQSLLEAAAMLHNVGLFINHAAHHKHSYYVIRHSEQLTGFSERELEVVANVARYHRKSHPKQRHEPFAALSPSDQATVRVLAGLLRIAIGLDRQHRQAVESVAVRIGAKKLTITPQGSGGQFELEAYSAANRAALLAKALDRRIVIEGA
ncbi:MAG: Ppx/GppA family phosphatase [Acidimicrobiales bacterium]|nr:Ppx/GppA family phosphatase [Acidimicrobiales bacterium]